MKKTNSKVLSLILLLMVSLTIQAETRETIYSTRLIIGFHYESYQDLGSAVEASEYINKHSESDHKISLVRPLGNNAILVHVNHANQSELQKNVNQLLLLEKIRYIEIDSTMNPLRDRNMVCAQKVLVKIKNHRTSSLLCMSSRIMELSFASTF